MPDPKQIIDELLVLAALNGESNAIDQLVRRWHHRLLSHAHNMTGNLDAAKDVTQESWIHIIKRLKTLDDPAAFPGWAYQIVTRRSIDWVRGRQRDRRRFEKNRTAAHEKPNHTTPNNDLEQDEQKQRILDTLQQLPVDQRAVLSMHYLEDLSTPQIAQALNIPRGTVKSRMHQARNNLRSLLKDLEP